MIKKNGGEQSFTISFTQKYTEMRKKYLYTTTFIMVFCVPISYFALWFFVLIFL